jgi:drug/metabolite transporter (DMT)-like permease
VRQSTKVGLTIWAGLIAAIVLDTLAELFWKMGVNGAAGADLVQILVSCLTQPFFLLAMFLYIPKYFNWMQVLRTADLSYAKPITSLSTITILVVSAIVLHESITFSKVAGIAMVVAGVWLVSRTEMQTVGEKQ